MVAELLNAPRTLRFLSLFCFFFCAMLQNVLNPHDVLVFDAHHIRASILCIHIVIVPRGLLEPCTAASYHCPLMFPVTSARASTHCNPSSQKKNSSYRFRNIGFLHGVGVR